MISRKIKLIAEGIILLGTLGILFAPLLERLKKQ